MNRQLPIALLLITAPALAQWFGPDGQSVPDDPTRKSVNGFGAMLLLTTNPDGLLAEWELPPEHPPEIATTDRVARNEVLSAFVVFTGCRPKDGSCNSSVDFKVLRPDTSIYAELNDVELWRGKPAPPQGNVQLGVGNLGIRIEPQDPLGTYTVQATVVDHVGGTTLQLEIPFEAVED